MAKKDKPVKKEHKADCERMAEMFEDYRKQALGGEIKSAAIIAARFDHEPQYDWRDVGDQYDHYELCGLAIKWLIVQVSGCFIEEMVDERVAEVKRSGKQFI